MTSAGNSAGRTELMKHSLFWRLSAATWPYREWVAFDSSLNNRHLFTGLITWIFSHVYRIWDGFAVSYLTTLLPEFLFI